MGSLIYGMFCPAYNFPGLIRGGSGKHGDVVFRHDYFKAAAVIHALCPAQLFKVFAGIADVSAAGEYKIYIPAA